jgi:hypothetical protein
LPIVVTTAVADGLPPETYPALIVADSPVDYAEGVLKHLATSPEGRRALAATANLRTLEWPRTLESLARVLEDAVSTRLRSG